MKKILTFVMAAALAVTAFAGCGGNNNTSESAPAETPAAESSQEAAPESSEAEAPASEGGIKTGLAISNSIAKSAVADGVGAAQADSTVVAVMVDADGKIIQCVIDAAQSKASFGADGKITTPLDTEFKTKKELGAEYGMAKASSIGKEWNEQADALAAYVTGKTIDEVKAIAVSAEGKAEDAELAASVTVSISGYISTLEKAVANATAAGAEASDKLGLGIVTNIAKSKDAAAEDGQVQFYSTYAAVTTNGDKITSAALDASQSNVTFNAKGELTVDVAVAPKTKNELGADYGMAKASSIGKEWNEQAAAFAAYAAGKTTSEIEGIAVSEAGAPTDSELASSVTVGIGDFITVITKAVANAK